MDRKNDTSSGNDNSKLAALRSQIDEIDDRIIGLLMERIGIVGRVGELKNSSDTGVCPIRPGREAEMIRRIMRKFEGTAFPPVAAAAIWRIIIGTSTTTEADMKLSVFTPERDDNLWWLAHEYFGPSMPIIRQGHVKRVIGDVMDGKATVAIVPMLRSADTTYWWTNLMQQGKDTPRIFARIPFVNPSPSGLDTPTALAIARLEPEPSGNDISIIVLEAEHNVSQNRLQTAFAQAKLEVNWINVATVTPTTRHHLIEIKGFINSDHVDMKLFLAGLGSSIQSTCFLGAYAVPVASETAKKLSEPKMVSHAATVKA